MLGWPSLYEWQRDNRWQPLDTAPTDRAVDVFCHGWDASRRTQAERDTARRVHGARLIDGRWSGIPEGYKPKFWTEAMPAARIRALSA